MTGTYSNMHYVEEAEDVVGMEIWVLAGEWRQGGGYWVLFQLAEGAPSDPVLCRASVRGHDVQFTLPEPYKQMGSFSGTIRDGVLVGRFTKGQAVRLERKKSYWQ